MTVVGLMRAARVAAAVPPSPPRMVVAARAVGSAQGVM